MIKAEVVHQECNTAYVEFSLLLQKYGNKKEIMDKLDSLQNTLSCIDAKNSVEYKKIDSIKNLMKYQEYMELLKSVLPDVIVVPFVKYIEILKKYNLCSDLMSNYKGSIPEKNILEINNRSNILNSNCMGLYLNNCDFECNRFVKIRSINADKVSDERSLMRFPFCLDNPPVYNCSKLKNESLLISAPQDDFINPIFTIRREKKIVEDPIVFKLCPIGVIILSKWGDEANDEYFNF